MLLNFELFCQVQRDGLDEDKDLRAAYEARKAELEPKAELKAEPKVEPDSAAPVPAPA